ncbi:MAG: DNA polymerase IV [Eubacterium sp.]|nr:DNA polymerase IV [Eubacterium sp.]
MSDFPPHIIYHIDVNSAFLSWTAVKRLRDNPEALDIRTIPAVIGGDEKKRHGIVLAKSVPAKAYGIQTGEPLVQTRKKCPDILIVPPDFATYVSMSEQLMNFLKQTAPVVEQYSIDEAFCDMTGTGLLYGDPVAFAHQLKDDILNRFGFTVNIGISTNKLLAKMASDFKKPNLVHTLFPEEIPQKMWPLPVGELFFVGPSMCKKLEALGIHTIGDVAVSNPQLLVSHFKKHGELIWNYANGFDIELPVNHKAANKSFGNSVTLHFDVTDAENAKTILLSLSETVGARIRAEHAYIGVVSVTIVDNEFRHLSRQCTLSTPTDITEIIYENACRLFDLTWNHVPIRLLGVSTAHATDTAFHQMSLFDEDKNERFAMLNKAVDSIRDKYGEDSIKRARFLDNGCTHMSGGLNREKRSHKKNS